MKLVTLAALLCAMLALTRAAGFAEMESEPGKEEAIQEGFADMEFQPGKEEAIQEAFAEMEFQPGKEEAIQEVLPEAEAEPEPETEETNQEALLEMEFQPGKEETMLEGFTEAEPEHETEETNQEGDNDVANRSTYRRCPRRWRHYRGRCFRYFRYHLTWSGAEKFCKARRGHLASVHSYYELSVIRRVVVRSNRHQPRIWLGGYRWFFFWYWIDATRFHFVHWCTGYPSFFRCYMDLNTSASCMENISGSYHLPFVCSRKAW